MASDYIGCVFGLWTVEEYAYSKNYHRFYKCKCQCGNDGTIDIQSLKSGNSKSCGCLRVRVTKDAATKHGLSGSRINRIYRNMKSRCYNDKTPSYKKYGEKGIKICEEWMGEKGFANFYEWAMKHGYRDNLTIDRIDGGKGYSPENCRWTTPKKQANNISTNVVITYKGESHTVSEWSDITGINRRTIEERYKRNLPLERVFSTRDLRFIKEVGIANYSG